MRLLIAPQMFVNDLKITSLINGAGRENSCIFYVLVPRRFLKLHFL